MSDKFRAFFRDYVNYATVLLVCSVYTVSAFVTMGKTGQTVSEILVNTVLSFLVGVAINHTEKIQGVTGGLADERVQHTIRRFEEKVETLMPLIGELDVWCRQENQKNYVVQRTKVLSKVGLNYHQCFDEQGVAISFLPDVWPLVSIRKKGFYAWIQHNREAYRKWHGYRKAVRLKLTELTAGELTSEGENSRDPFKLGRSIHRYMTDTTAQDVASKLLISVIFGYYSVEQIVHFSWAMLIWRLIQVAIFLSIGAVKMDKSRLYVVGEYCGRMDSKYRHLCRFENDQHVADPDMSSDPGGGMEDRIRHRKET